MTSEEEVLRKEFTPWQCEQFEKTVTLITGPFTDPLARATIKRVYYQSVIAAFHAGRLTGMQQLVALVGEALPPQVGRALADASRGLSLLDGDVS